MFALALGEVRQDYRTRVDVGHGEQSAVRVAMNAR